MWEALNTTSLSICRTMCELGHLLAHSISNVLSCCKPPTTYWFLNLGNKVKVAGKIGSRVGRNQTTVMRICDHWMQEGKTNQRGRSHPPQYTTSRDDRKTVRMAVKDHSVISRTVTQQIESVTHHSVSARTIRHRLQQSGLSAKRPLLHLHLTQNHRHLRHQWCD
ncbi:transposable element Tcb1 transposase [Trichonephila clavipes]|nr:transposable element Tcb1 transposase [Trichonephila clavipes]